MLLHFDEKSIELHYRMNFIATLWIYPDKVVGRYKRFKNTYLKELQEQYNDKFAFHQKFNTFIPLTLIVAQLLNAIFKYPDTVVGRYLRAYKVPTYTLDFKKKYLTELQEQYNDKFAVRQKFNTFISLTLIILVLV